MKIVNTDNAREQIINTKKDWFSKYELEDGILEFYFENSEEQLMIFDKLLQDLINRPKNYIFFNKICFEYINSNKEVLFFEGVGKIKNTRELAPVSSYLETIINFAEKQ